MTTWFNATCTKEIFWHGETHKQGDQIKILEEDMRILSEAAVIGDIKKIHIPDIEQAIREAPENEMKRYAKRPRP